jgi:exopolysaccharide biosynthesis polyprenyl glycosylphosphotransferase
VALLAPDRDFATAATLPRLSRPSLPTWLIKAYLIGADLSAVVIALTLAFRLRTLMPGGSPDGTETQHMQLAALSLPLWLASFAYYRLYASRFLTTRLEELSRVIHACGTAVVGTAVLAFMLQWYVYRGWLVLSFVLAVPLLAGERELVRRLFGALRKKGRMRRATLIVGANADGLDICDMLASDNRHGYEVVGFVDASVPVGATVYDGCRVVGDLDDTMAAVELVGATSVIIVTSAVDTHRTNRLVRQLTDAGIHVELSSSLADIAAGRLTVRPLGRFPVLYIEPVRRKGWRGAAKRAFDVTVALAGIVVLAPAWVVIALAIKLDSRGPVLFKQTRVGREGVPFKVWKLRTMVPDAEDRLIDLVNLNEGAGPLFKIASDPRVTRLGRWLRRLSLDEFPQLWNVLRGEMSLVGPRPALAGEMHAWTPDLHERLRVRPGLTGMWQVSGRSNATFEEYVRLDLYYVDNWSLWADVAIVAKTIPTLLLQRGAY